MFDKNTASRGERGNALFLILIAVALFAALSYAITQSGRGGGTVDKEQALITAAAISEYPATLRTAVTRMLITGTPGYGVATAITTTGSTGQSYELFSPEGGGASINPPPSGSGAAITALGWVFVDANDATANGWWVLGVGTDGGSAGREVLAVLGNAANSLSLTVCQQINKGLGQVSPFQPAFIAGAATNWAAAGAYAVGGNANTLVGGADAGFQHDENVTGQPFSCYTNATAYDVAGPFNYYHALVEQ